MNKVYLSRKNLLDLLSKLDNPNSTRTLVKLDTTHPVYPSSAKTMVIAVPDEEYYSERDSGVTADDMIENILKNAEFLPTNLTLDTNYVYQKLNTMVGFGYIKSYLLKKFNNKYSHSTFLTPL